MKNIVGIDPKLGSVESGLYATSLTGISLCNIDASTTRCGSVCEDESEEQQSIQELFAIVESNSIKQMLSVLFAKITACYKICDKETLECLVCENKNLLYVPLWKLIGMKLCEERFYSDRLNFYTNIKKDDCEKLIEKYGEEFNFDLENAVKAFDLSACVACVEPVGVVRYVECLP